jgi:hypothetical protein
MNKTSRNKAEDGMFFNEVKTMYRVFLIIVCILNFACNDNKAKNTTVATPPPPKYYFYPKANVYFDTVNKDYIFLGSDGATWTSGKQIPAAMHSMMDKSVLLDTFSQPVWRDNENHRLIYSAVLYATPADTIEKEEPPLVLQPPVNPDSDKKKEKKGLRKFLDKIFGKKKKDQEADEN